MAINNKIKTLKELIPIVKQLKKEKKKIVTTNGVFDIVHPGHVKYLENAKKLGSVLIVGVNSDYSVKRNKGDKRPINDEKSRIIVLAAIESIDFVFIFNENDPRKWLSIIKPNVHVKAGDYKKNEIAEKGVVESNNGIIKIMQFERGYSTTSVIQKITKLYCKN